MKYFIFLLSLFVGNVFAAGTLLTATTSATQSNSFKLSGAGNQQNNLAAATVIIYAASGHTAGEYSDIQISHDGCTTFADLYYDGVQVRLHSTNTAVTLYGPGCFRVDKESTTNATGVYISNRNDI